MAGEQRSMRVEAVVLRHADWGEADRLVTLYTREEGKLQAIAKGARKIRSRKAGHLEPFTRVALLLARGRDLWIITQAETVEPHLSIRENLDLIVYASVVVESLDRFTYEEGQNLQLYQLLIDTLARLERMDDPFIVVSYYQVRLLDHLGFRPNLFTCVQCEAEIQPQNQYFSPIGGGVLCPRCGSNAAGAIPVTLDALKYLRHYQRSGYKDARRAQIPLSTRREMENLLRTYFTFLLERALNSPDFLSRLRGPNRNAASA